MTKKRTYRKRWQSKFEGQIDYYRDEIDYFEGWDRNRRPESEAENNLVDALTILYAGGPADMASKFLNASIAVVDRAINEGKLDSRAVKRG